MYRINLIRSHKYLSDRQLTDFDLSVAELLVMEQLANGHKWMTEIKQNCGITDYTMSKSVMRLSDGYGGHKGLELITKHRDGKHKFMSFTMKGLKVRDAIMDYRTNQTEKKETQDVLRKTTYHRIKQIKNIVIQIEETLHEGR